MEEGTWIMLESKLQREFFWLLPRNRSGGSTLLKEIEKRTVFCPFGWSVLFWSRDYKGRAGR